MFLVKKSYICGRKTFYFFLLNNGNIFSLYIFSLFLVAILISVIFFPPIVRFGARGCNEGRALRVGQTWEFYAWEIAHLGNCHLGK